MRSLVWGVLALSVALPAHGAVVEKFSVGQWEGEAYTSQETGKFNHCTISAGYRSGIGLIFAVNVNWGFSFALGNPAWSLSQGATYPISYSIDGTAARQVAARAFRKDAVEVELSATESEFAKFKFGKVLTVYANGGTFNFNLDGTAAALERLRACVTTHRTASSGSNPFAGSAARSNPFGAPSGGARPQPATGRALVKDVAETLVTSGLLPGFQLLTGDRVPEHLRTADVVWRSPSGLGWGMYVAPGQSPEKIIAGEFSYDSGRCKGAYASGSKDEEVTTGYHVRRGFSMCDSGNSWRYTIYPFKDGSFLKVTTPHSSAKDADDEQIFRAVKAVKSSN